MKHYLAMLGVLLIMAQPVVAEPVPAQPTVGQIVDRLAKADEARLTKLRHYTSIRHYSLENKRFGVRATMTVRVTYEYPGTKHFEILEQSGPAAIRKRVFRRMLDSELQPSAGTRISAKNYDFALVGSRMLDGRECFVLKAWPRTNNPLLFRGDVYIDAQDYAVAKLDGTPATNPSFWLHNTAIEHRYGKFGAFWLPLSNDSGSDVRMFGHTRVRIEYSDYRINAEEREAAARPAS